VRKSLLVETATAIVAAATAIVAGGCGSSGSASPTAPVIAPAKVYRLGQFTPTHAVTAGRPVALSFKVFQPSGQPLVHYRTGAGPHVGVHLIAVRRDLAVIIHRHPPIGPGGLIRQTMVFPRPGPYHLLVDIYPAHRGPGYVNFQLTRTIQVSGTYHPQPLPPFRSTVSPAPGVTFALHGKPSLRVAQASIFTVSVDLHGHPVRFVPWYGALAHAIFFHERDLAYFHTHVCAPGAAGCTSTLGSVAVSGNSTTPGVLHVGVLLPEPGVWRMFLQCRAGGAIVTAPFTLSVKP
jgi:hypothetical protein